MVSQTVLVFVSVQMKGAVSMNRKKKCRGKPHNYNILFHCISCRILKLQLIFERKQPMPISLNPFQFSLAQLIPPN